MGINYNNESELFKKGSILVGGETEAPESIEKWACSSSEEAKHLQKREISVLHCDVIGDKFWTDRPELLLSLKELKKLKKEQFKSDSKRAKKE